MSFMGRLAKIAIGVAVAKGVGQMMSRSGGSSSGGGSLGGLLGGAGGSRPSNRAGAGTGLEDMMGSILGGRGSSGGSTSGPAGGLGGLLESLSGQSTRSASGSRGASQSTGLDGLLGGLASGGLGGLLGGLAGAGGASAAPQRRDQQESFGTILNQSFANNGEPDTPPTPEQDAMAALMLRAMIQAAKCDGKIDAAEKEKLLGNMGEVSAEEMRFIQGELAAPVDVDSLARQVPKGLEAQVYTMSVMAIDLDSQAEAQYLHQLADAMGMRQQDVNHIHAELGVPALYA